MLLLLVSLCTCEKQKAKDRVPTNADYEKGESFMDLRNDSAFYYYNKVAASSADSLLVAMANNRMACIQTDAGDYFGSQQSLLLSLKFLEELKKEDRKCLASDYNELGNTSLGLNNYDEAIKYYDFALKLSSTKLVTRIGLNNKAIAYRKKKQYAQAIAIYESIIKETDKNRKEYARILSNLAKVKWLLDSNYNAAHELLTALHIREKEKDEWGLNASYAHLSDYYLSSHPALALHYANKMFETAQELHSPDDELEALQKLIPLSPAKKSKRYFARYLYLRDSVQTSRNAAKSQFALIRFEAEKNKADILRLQKENAEKGFQIVFLVLAVLILVAITIIIINLNRKRKQRIQLKAQNSIRESKLKTSKQVHDVVANGLYQIMVKVQHDNDMDKDTFLDEIEMLYEKSRDISYEQPVTDNVDFSNEIKQLLTSFSTPDIKVLLVGNDKELWVGVKGNVKNELKHVLQELMVNMRKHSSAKNVVVKFDQQKNLLLVQYTDDGTGLKAGFSKGNGLAGMENRIDDVGGNLTFDTHTTKGLKIYIRIPIS
ncbi:tetratricopeptide repeat-containing sensor histidine kinase [Pinibacter aurantiacus]|uniref:histidine kinase n=1 Tax=Pinibacter aurantiacus TaxID=2851599 RepID=A0A9E2W9E1_9BACT|nr:ATP-binding protein [Pinibacter aurantiacus]MBV4359926.1 ATP-binding protein [Pinibacter aurantiacus]